VDWILSKQIIPLFLEQDYQYYYAYFFQLALDSNLTLATNHSSTSTFPLASLLTALILIKGTGLLDYRLENYCSTLTRLPLICSF